ncbi:hypothetical protein N783_13080 [Pontibacillus marinus BH030004 = DSM 16465]|uniref:Uncharacterized protein n=2 Tax=Pontibacillus TaxID=289201 RepID=A0A0A5G1J4_9BACI|nr:hypothetical protein N783_13080 [Pontibacillus marinus BH030004 = DSM 16465]
MIIFFISILLLTSLKLCKKQFHPFELFLLFIFSSIMCQLTFYKLFSYDRLGIVPEWWQDLTAKMHFGIVLPITLLWTMYIFKSNTNEIGKVTALFGWIMFSITIEKIFLQIGVLESKSHSWYPSLDMTFGMFIIIMTIFFMNQLTKILRKDNIIK